MATLETSARNGACNGVVDLVDAGAGAGKLIFRTVADATVAVLTFSDPAFSTAGSVTAGVATAAAITSDVNAAGGTTTKASFEDSNAATVMAVTVGVGSGEISLSSTAIGVGDTVAVSALTVTMPAS